jgi:hypothetical protein
MATDSSSCPLRSKRAAPPTARAAASALGHLARLLARQAAREVMASGLVALPHSAGKDTSGTTPVPVVDSAASNKRSIG